MSKSSDERIERHKQKQQHAADARVQEQQRAVEERARKNRFLENVREKWARDSHVIAEILKEFGAKLGGQFQLTDLGAPPPNNAWRGRLTGCIGNQAISVDLTIDEHGQLQAAPPQMVGSSHVRIHGSNPLNVPDATRERYEHFILDLLDISKVSFTDD
jgi:hypothetical protein